MNKESLTCTLLAISTDELWYACTVRRELQTQWRDNALGTKRFRFVSIYSLTFQPHVSDTHWHYRWRIRSSSTVHKLFLNTTLTTISFKIVFLTLYTISNSKQNMHPMWTAGDIPTQLGPTKQAVLIGAQWLSIRLTWLGTFPPFHLMKTDQVSTRLCSVQNITWWTHSRYQIILNNIPQSYPIKNDFNFLISKNLTCNIYYWKQKITHTQGHKHLY
jgi:hypothetical protein